jgi:membrane-associated phospholipid phosphatase
MVQKLFLVGLLLAANVGYATNETRLGFLDTFTEIPSTSKAVLSNSFSKDSIPGWSFILGSTAILFHYDEKLISFSQDKGRDWGIGNEDHTKSVVQAFGYELVRLPSDTGSALYFLGDGWMHFAIAGSIAGYGYASDQTYEVNTGLIIVHGMFVSTIFSQALKRSFGRESPEVKTSERGAWKPFPSFNEYNTRTASYDAMPSGHVMTATLTFTILAERYPEHKVQIYSVGGVWVTALMFQMMNNGVHWASDYPLGIGIGWVVAQASVKIAKKQNTGDQSKTSWDFWPVPTNGGAGFIAQKKF